MRRLLVKLATAMLRLLPAYPSDEYKPIDQMTHEIALRRTKEEIEDERATGFLRFFEEFELPAATVALDLGCGFGGRTIEFQKSVARHVIGLEIDSRVVAPAYRFANPVRPGPVSFIAGIGEALPLAAESVDLV